MRVKLAILAALTLSLAAIQCDHGPLSLFPSFLTEVSHHYNLSAGLPYVSGAKYFLNVMWAGNLNTDLVYLVRALPDGNRTLVILNGVLEPVGVFILPEAGDLHHSLDDANHLVGTCLVTIPMGGVPTVGPASGFPAVDCRDWPMARTPSYNIMFSPPVFAGTNTVVNYYRTGLSLPLSFTAGSFTIEIADRVLVLEGAANDSSSSVWMVFRDAATNDGYLLWFGSDTPPTPVYETNFGRMGRIVPGTVRFSEDGRPVAEKPNGRLCRFNSDGSENDGTDTNDFHDYIVAYGSSGSMYLFKPSTGDLLKTLAWWRSPGY